MQLTLSNTTCAKWKSREATVTDTTSLIVEKTILDACCGSRMFWFDKSNPAAVYGDIRTEDHILCDGRALNIAPDVEMDFTAIPFPDSTFRLVVFDPPHIENLGKNSWMAKKYGVLGGGWEDELKQGFDECLRVL